MTRIVFTLTLHGDIYWDDIENEGDLVTKSTVSGLDQPCINGKPVYQSQWIREPFQLDYSKKKRRVLDQVKREPVNVRREIAKKVSEAHTEAADALFMQQLGYTPNQDVKPKTFPVKPAVKWKDGCCDGNGEECGGDPMYQKCGHCYEGRREDDWFDRWDEDDW